MSKGKAKGSTGTPATVALTKAGIDYAIRSYDHDPNTTSYGQEAADALGVPAEQIFKTLLADVDGRIVVGIVPVTGSLDLKALAAAAGGKRAVMADSTLAQRVTGYVLGGISPIGQRKTSPTVLDTSALDFTTILVSGGRRGLDIELNPQDLIKITSATTAPIGRPD